MKFQFIRLFALAAASLLFADAASAAVSSIAYYRLGENDPGASAGQTADATTIDIGLGLNGSGGVNLHQAGIPPTYSSNAALSGSTLCIAVNGGGYTNDAPILTPNDNWGIEAWVLADTTNNTIASSTNLPDGYAQIAYNGNSGVGGMGIYSAPGGLFVGLCGRVALVVGSPIVTNTWTHLAMVVADGTTTFYVNGVANGTAPAPGPTTNFFGLGINPSGVGGGEEFQGSIDEVRVFAFADGEFSTNDLLLFQVPPLPQQGLTILAGPTPTPAGALLSGTNFYADGTSMTLGIAIGGPGPTSFQWTQNSTNIPGATNATLYFASLAPSNSGNYNVVAINSKVSVTSSVVSIAVMSAGSPSVIPLAYYRLGENDPGAVAGQTGDSNTVDIISGQNLAINGTPTYDSQTGVNGSALCIDVDGGGYSTNEPISILPDNWGVEAWVKATTTTAPDSGDTFATIVYNGDSGVGGMGFYQNGNAGQFSGLCGGIAFIGGATIVPNAWVHLALVDTGGQTTFYVNGVASGTGPPPGVSTNAFSIGFNPFFSENFQGSIDEVRVFAVLPGHFSVSDLLLTQVPPGSSKPTIINGPTASPGNLVATGGTLSIGVVPSGTAPLAYQWYQGGVAVPNQTNASLFLTNVTSAQSGQYDVIITNTYGSATSAVAAVTVLPVGVSSLVPLAHYRLGENDPGAAAGQPANATTVDIVNGFDLYQGGAASMYAASTAVPGSALCVAVNGGGYETNAALPTPADNWGIEAWVLATSTSNGLSGDGYAQIAYNGDSGPGGMGLYAEPGGKFCGLCGSVAVVGGSPIVTNTWTHLAMVTSGGTTTFYVNGVANGTSGAPNPASSYFGIGINPSGAGGGEEFQGSIDEVRVFTFTPGLFSTNSLLLNQVPLAPTIAILPPAQGATVIVPWNGAALQEASTIAGPWTTISNATAPWVAPETGSSGFFRAVGQP